MLTMLNALSALSKSSVPGIRFYFFQINDPVTRRSRIEGGSRVTTSETSWKRVNPPQFERARGKGSLMSKKEKKTGGLTSFCQPEKTAQNGTRFLECNERNRVETFDSV